MFCPNTNNIYNWGLQVVSIMSQQINSEAGWWPSLLCYWCASSFNEMEDPKKKKVTEKQNSVSGGFLSSFHACRRNATSSLRNCALGGQVSVISAVSGPQSTRERPRLPYASFPSAPPRPVKTGWPVRGPGNVSLKHFCRERQEAELIYACFGKRRMYSMT